MLSLSRYKKKVLLEFLVATSLLVFLFIVSTSYAHAATFIPDRIVPECKTSGGQIALCTFCDFLTLIQNVLNFMFWVVTPLVLTAALFWGGALMFMSSIQGSVDMGTRGKKVIGKTLIGVALVLASWLIIDTVIKTVGGRIASDSVKSGGFGPWNEISCSAQGTPIVAPPIDKPTGGGDTPTGGGTTLKCSADRTSNLTNQMVGCVREQGLAQGLSVLVTSTNTGEHTCEPKPPQTPTNVSCHYGGTKCNGEAHAADFSLPPGQQTPTNWSKLRALTLQCGARSARCEFNSTNVPDCGASTLKPNHVHANDAAPCGCN